jgi:hypothetical protein
MAALAAGGTAYSVSEQNKATKVTEESAKSSAAADYMATTDAAEQTNAAAAGEAMKLKRQALVERGRIVSAQSETGFIGNSPLREMLIARTKEAEALGTTQTNLANALTQNSRDTAKIFSVAQSRVNEAKANYASPWAAGLMIATSGVEGAGKGYTYGSTRKGKK